MKEKKVVLVTGGTSRLGKVIVSRLLNEGCVVYATSRSNQESHIPQLRYLKMDVTSDSSVAQAMAEIYSKTKRLDMIINNAGISLNGPALSFTATDFLRLLDVNAVGPFRVMKSAMERKQKPETIINITSLNGLLTLPQFALYSSSKHAIQALSIALSHEIMPDTQVITLAPGALKAESDKKMQHKPLREKVRFINWLFPLTTLDDVADHITRILRTKKSSPLVIVGRDAKLMHYLQKLLPFALFYMLISRLMNKERN